MTRYALRRLLGLVPMLLIVATAVFVLVRLAPGGPFDTERQVPAEIRAALDAYYHQNDPIWRQYLDWLGRLVVHGDLGPCFKYPNRTVNEIIAASLPVSMELGVFGLLFALVVGVPLGIVGATKQNTAADTAAMATSMIGVSIPRFVLAPLLILLFALKLYWLPVARWETWRHMLMPIVCAGLPMAAYVARLTRGGLLEVIRSDFVRTARAKGLSERVVVVKHALRGGLLPVVSYLGPGFSGLLVGSLVVEKIFDIPGMGRYFVEAAQNRDYNLLVGVTLVYAAILLVANTFVDIAYALLDPRVELR
ncbi:MAG TPA: ABC transporter permease [Minicystis sp.]|nr:ABC transporter permease [Minicystis sp.]